MNWWIVGPLIYAVCAVVTYWALGPQETEAQKDARLLIAFGWPVGLVHLARHEIGR